jgi:hypothetical protein
MINDIKCLFSTLQSIQPVHELFKSTLMKPGMVVIFYHGIGFGKHNEWKKTHGHHELQVVSSYVGHKSSCLQTWRVKILIMFGFFLYHMIQLFFLVPTPM